MTTRFKYLRIFPWVPAFKWVGTTAECARMINAPHDDYPKYVDYTDYTIRCDVDGAKATNGMIRSIHRLIFRDKDFAGRYRDVNVMVGNHRPPNFELVDKFMDELEHSCSVDTIGELLDWYWDFETVHPLLDGNGRVGGVMVALHSHRLHPDMGWLAPNQ